MIMVGPSAVSGEFRMWCTKCNSNILRRTKAVRALTITDLANTHQLKCSAWFKRDDPSADSQEVADVPAGVAAIRAEQEADRIDISELPL